jgi:hypothetical protein
MPDNIIVFPSRSRVAEEPAQRWRLRCVCGSTEYHVHACGEIACAECEASPELPGVGEVRAQTVLFPEALPSA